MQTVVEQGRPVVVSVPGGLSLPAAADWLTERGDDVERLRLEHGAVMLRGLPFTSPDEFAVLRDRLISEPADYVEKATPRSGFGKGVFTATNFPARETIRLHNENSYALRFPGLLVFGCVTAPEVGGATFLGDMRKMMTLLPADILDRFREVGWTLVRNYWGHLSLSWQEAFSTSDQRDVERYAAEQKLTTAWYDERLCTTQTRSATIRHPRTGEETWFNHVSFWSEWSLADGVRDLLREECGDDLPFRTFYGDGEPVGQADIEVINKALAEVRVAELWQPGDIMVVDNVRMAHGRDPYQGARQVVVGMGNPVDRAACEVSA